MEIFDLDVNGKSLQAVKAKDDGTPNEIGLFLGKGCKITYIDTLEKAYYLTAEDAKKGRNLSGWVFDTGYFTKDSGGGLGVLTQEQFDAL